MKHNIKAFSLAELTKEIADLGIESYRGPQIFQWLWQKNAREFKDMTNLAKDFRRLLEDRFEISGPTQAGKTLARDGTEKFLFRLADGHNIETVYIPEAKRRTICVSTQVGCPLGCKFCATALMGFKRNLAAHEIAGQVQSVASATGVKPTNIVFMGMGEPLLNIPAVEDAIAILSAETGLGISQRHITISTVGLLDGIRHFLRSASKVKLAISLNFADPDLREKMMPATRKNPLPELLILAREYARIKRRVTFEYVMIGGLNDRIKDADRLVKILKGIPSKINLIPYNTFPGLPFQKPDPLRQEKFHQFLLLSRHVVTLRKSHGPEIFAACGQLAGNREQVTGRRG
jgi:23S rRNA (adenine2503-C2)-methyltransferase